MLGRMTRNQLTEQIVVARLAKGLTWQELADAIGRPLLWTTSALLGQHPIPAELGRILVDKLGLDESAVPVLAAPPMRGGLPTAVPTDPTIYRFYEALQVYGGALKEVIAEQFGDGIMSAINFSVDLQKKPHPSGDRVVVTFDGKFLPYQWVSSEQQVTSKTEPAKPVDLVLSGGGVKFIGLVGAIVALMDAGYSIKRVSGVSAGSVVAAILAAGCHAGELTGAQVKELAFSVPLHKWRDAGPVPYLGAAWGLARDTSMYRGDVAHDWIRSELKNFGVSTFGDLVFDGDDLPDERRRRLVVTVADVTAAQLVRLPWDYRRLYGLDPDEQPVADAVRASMAIPFFYRPVKLARADGTACTLVDGGVLSNFPIDTFDRPDGRAPRWPTFGITVMPSPTEGIGAVMPALKPLRFLPQTALLESLLITMLAGHDQTHLSQPWVAARAIAVESTNVGVLDFDVPRSRLEELYDSGYAAAQAFLSTWDWQGYLDRFRYPGGRG